MRLLTREGQFSAALAQYETCRRILWEEFAVEPAAKTTALLQYIRDARCDKAESGVQWSGLAVSRVAPLPPEPTPFVGREADRAALAEYLANPATRLITLTGPGGVGKTRLALQVAADAMGLFADGVVFASLETISSSELVAREIAESLGISSDSQRNLPQQILAYLRSREVLLVLDNLEHLVECCNIIVELLRHASQIVILCTSREHLHLREEWLYEVSGLQMPGVKPTPDFAPEHYDALMLFQQRATQFRPQFTLTPEVLPHVIHICKLLEGLPLGIELAAACILHQSCAEIAEALAQSLDALPLSPRNAPARHRSLRAVFDHAWGQLALEEQAVFSAAAVFEGGFDVAAARAVLGNVPTTLTILTALATKSLLRVREGRYTFHGTLHCYAKEKLTAEPERLTALETRHSAY